MWNGKSPIQERYPNLLLISRDKNAKVADYLVFKNGYCSWNLLFIKVVNDWELESMAHLQEDLNATKFQHWEESRFSSEKLLQDFIRDRKSVV